MESTPLSDVSDPVRPSLAVSLDDDAFWSLIRDRRSIRRYADRPIDESTLTRILEAATWAPSAHNRQPWRFCVVTDREVKHDLSRQMGARWRVDLTRDGADSDFVERRVAASHARITGAAALIVPAVSMADMDHYPDARRNEAEWLMAVQSVALACQNLLLAAHHYGVGACWMCAPLFVPELVRSALALPDEWHPQALITLGHPAEVKQKDRAPLETRVIWR
jgi:coenzyme F420-0:L-glutamate ligase/coenzyme F420-1:gamma-L-glutamate ligase